MEKRFASEHLDAEKQAVADRMNLDEGAVPRWSIPPIASKTAEEFLRTERPRLLKQFAELIYGEIPPPQPSGGNRTHLTASNACDLPNMSSTPS